MFDLNAFIRQGHLKVIEHYKRLRDTAHSDVERQHIERRMAEEFEAMRREEKQASFDRRAA